MIFPWFVLIFKALCSIDFFENFKLAKLKFLSPSIPGEGRSCKKNRFNIFFFGQSEFSFQTWTGFCWRTMRNIFFQTKKLVHRCGQIRFKVERKGRKKSDLEKIVSFSGFSDFSYRFSGFFRFFGFFYRFFGFLNWFFGFLNQFFGFLNRFFGFFTGFLDF